MIIHVSTVSGGYDIVSERGALDRLGGFLDPGVRTLIVTDDGVPTQHVQKVEDFCAHADCVTIPQGEASKCRERLFDILDALVDGEYTRKDRVISVGGGVVGDLAGFAASIYMRGIEFVNIPTTLLSQVDSSVGGKTAIDYRGVKNIVGSFYPPARVIIDRNVLATLPRRQVANGLAEALKMAITHSESLFALFEEGDPFARIDEIGDQAILIKKAVVESDEKEAGLRRVLNFGHTLGHGIESVLNGALLHGECVALGMLPMCGEDVRARLIPVLCKIGLPTAAAFDADRALEICMHDKKSVGADVVTVRCRRIGSFEFVNTPPQTLAEQIKQVVKP
ncbi:MAG: 3-dehydroquinate synthase [Clostridia bacterium]|nr:3-dehydroquinate synthase [Clostridia bacterium]